MSFRAGILPLIALLIPLWSLAETPAAQTLTAGDTMSVQLDISTRDVQPLNPLVYGFNSNLSKVAWRYNSADYARAVADLQPAALRFPGGTTANFYHWNPASPWDPDLNETNSFYRDEIDSISDPKLRKSILAARNSLQRNNPSNPTLSFDEFMALSKANGIKPVIVVNVHTGTPEEAAAWVKYTVDNNFEVAYWELGNELYMKRYWYKDTARSRSVFRTVSRNPGDVSANAAALMENVLPAFVAAMRAASPTPIRISVTAAPFDELEAKPDNAKWDSVLARTKYDYYDAYTVHKYTGVPYDGTPVPNRNNAPYKFAEYANWFFNDNARNLDELLAHYRKQYGARRDMIVTEWNYYGFAHPQYNRSVINMTHLGALFVGDRLSTLLQNGGRISLAMYHNLGSVGRWPSPVARDRTTGEARRNPWFYPFYLVGQALEGKTQLVGATLRNAPPISGKSTWNPGTQYQFTAPYTYPGVNAVVLGDRGGSFAVLLTNRTAAIARLEINVDRKRLSRSLKSRCFANPDLGSEVAASLRTGSLAEDLRRNLLTQTFDGGDVTLPAYSYCLLEFNG